MFDLENAVYNNNHSNVSQILPFKKLEDFILNNYADLKNRFDNQNSINDEDFKRKMLEISNDCYHLKMLINRFTMPNMGQIQFQLL